MKISTEYAETPRHGELAGAIWVCHIWRLDPGQGILQCSGQSSPTWGEYKTTPWWFPCSASWYKLISRICWEALNISSQLAANPRLLWSLTPHLYPINPPQAGHIINVFCLVRFTRAYYERMLLLLHTVLPNTESKEIVDNKDKSSLNLLE